MNFRKLAQYLPFLYSSVFATGYNDIWTSFNHTVSGHLHGSNPFSLPCFSAYEGEAVLARQELCSLVQVNYTNSRFRAQYYNGFQNNQDEICLANTTAQCLLDPTNTADQTAFVNK